MKHTKKLTIIVAGLLVVSLLSGCGKTSDSASNGGKESGKKKSFASVGGEAIRVIKLCKKL